MGVLNTDQNPCPRAFFSARQLRRSLSTHADHERLNCLRRGQKAQLKIACETVTGLKPALAYCKHYCGWVRLKTSSALLNKSELTDWMTLAGTPVMRSGRCAAYPTTSSCSAPRPFPSLHPPARHSPAGSDDHPASF